MAKPVMKIKSGIRIAVSSTTVPRSRSCLLMTILLNTVQICKDHCPSNVDAIDYAVKRELGQIMQCVGASDCDVRIMRIAAVARWCERLVYHHRQSSALGRIATDYVIV